MSTSIDPQPKENEIECAGCGAYFYYELTRCPECGVNIYEPEDESEYETNSFIRNKNQGVFSSNIKSFLRKVFGKPYLADEVFGDGLNQVIVYNNLLQKVSGDYSALERLVEYEKKKLPDGTQMTWLQNAIERWDRDNRIKK